jgi:Ribonuclease G/E
MSSEKRTEEEVKREAERLKVAVTSEQLKRLEDIFRATIYRELGRVPRAAMSLFNAELDAVRRMPYEEAVKAVKKLAEEVIKIEREKAQPARAHWPHLPIGFEVGPPPETHPRFSDFLAEVGLTSDQYWALPPYTKLTLLEFFRRWLEKRGL